MAAGWRTLSHHISLSQILLIAIQVHAYPLSIQDVQSVIYYFRNKEEILKAVKGGKQC